MQNDRDKSLNFDTSVDGQRIRLVSTDDPFTDLKPGDTGTAAEWNNCMNSCVLFVRWDKGGFLGLIENRDTWEWINA